MVIGNKEFDFKNKTYLMGILNVTEDSFSDGGKYTNIDSQLRHVEKMIEEGADIIDIGGESTRPGSQPVSSEEEMERVIPIIQKVKSTFNIPISLDTYKSDVAKEGARSGADLINDIGGLKKDIKISHVIKEYELPVVIMHNRADGLYQDLMTDIIRDLNDSLKIAEEAKISKEKIILDPGIGFQKSSEECLRVIKNLGVLTQAFPEYPWLMAASRKSFIGNTLNLDVNNRLEGTLAVTAISCMNGFSIIRVHDIKENRRVIDLINAMRR